MEVIKRDGTTLEFDTRKLQKGFLLLSLKL